MSYRRPQFLPYFGGTLLGIVARLPNKRLELTPPVVVELLLSTTQQGGAAQPLLVSPATNPTRWRPSGISNARSQPARSLFDALLAAVSRRGGSTARGTRAPRRPVTGSHAPTIPERTGRCLAVWPVPASASGALHIGGGEPTLRAEPTPAWSARGRIPGRVPLGVHRRHTRDESRRSAYGPSHEQRPRRHAGPAAGGACGSRAGWPIHGGVGPRLWAAVARCGPPAQMLGSTSRSSGSASLSMLNALGFPKQRALANQQALYLEWSRCAHAQDTPTECRLFVPQCLHRVVT